MIPQTVGAVGAFRQKQDRIAGKYAVCGIVNKVCRKKQNRIVRAAVYSSGPLASHHKTSNGTDASSNLLLKIQLPSCHPSS